MGIFEWIGGWERIEEKRVNPKILKAIKSKEGKISPKVAGNVYHSGHVYKTMRGERMASYIPSFKFHIKGKSFVYRIKTARCSANEGNGHGFYTSKGNMKIWRKKKEK